MVDIQLHDMEYSSDSDTILNANRRISHRMAVRLSVWISTCVFALANRVIPNIIAFSSNILMWSDFSSCDQSPEFYHLNVQLHPVRDCY